MTLIVEPTARTGGSVDNAVDAVTRVSVVPPTLILVGAAAMTSAAILVAPINLAIPDWARSSTTTRTPERVVAPPISRDVLTPATLLQSVRDESGLTWDQIARVFGVSRRAVHHWMAGGNLSAHNIELLGRFNRLVGNLPGDSADARKAALFAAGPDGVSPIDAFRRVVATSSAEVHPQSASKAALLGQQ